MTTEAKTPPRQPPPVPPQPHHEEFTGPFGFFRKYQKPILYTAGFFALITFSITGAITGVFDRLLRKTGELPTLVVLDRTVSMQQDDYDIGQALNRGAHMPTIVLPHIDMGEGSDSERAECYAILRRVAITEGLEVSDHEVERAINFACAYMKSMSAMQGRQETEVTPTDLALRLGRVASLAELRLMVKEAMRIGNYMRLQGLVADGSDAAALEDLLRGKEKLTLKVASLDGKAIEDQLKTSSQVTDEQLREFLDKMSEQDRNIHQLYDTNRVSLQVGALSLAQFDPAQWTKELGSFTPAEADLLRHYEEDKDPKFKVDPATWPQQDIYGPPPEFWPPMAETVQQSLKQTALAEEAVSKLLTTIRDQRAEALKDPNEALRKANEEHGFAVQARDQSKARLAANPDDATLKADLAEKEAAVTPKKEALDAANEALKQARLAFDFGKAFTDATAGRSGVRVVTVPGLKNAEELKTLPEDLGTWNNPWTALAVPNVGDLGAQVARTDKSIMLVKVTELVTRPLKQFDKVKEQLKGVWFTAKAKEQVEEKKKALDAALLRLGKEKAAEKVAEIEGKRQTRIDEAFNAWEKKVEADLKEARRILQEQRNPESRAARDYRDKVAKFEKDLADKENKRKEIGDQTGKEVDAEIQKEASKFYGQVAEPAVAEAGFTVTPLGPLRRDLETTPRWDERYGEPAKFLWQGGKLKDLKQGEATEILDDATNRKLYFIVVDKAEPLEVTDLSRKEYEMHRRELETLRGMGSFRETRVAETIAQSYTLQALKERYFYKTSQKDPEAVPGNGSGKSGAKTGGTGDAKNEGKDGDKKDGKEGAKNEAKKGG